MSAPDPEGMGLLAKAIAAGVAVCGPVVGAVLWIENRFAKKHTVTSQLQAVHSELATQRSQIEKVVDQIRENEGKSEERHRELLMHLIEKKE